MDLQHQAAQELQEAFAARQINAVLAHRADGYLVVVREHPEASIHFGYGNLRELVVQLIINGNRRAIPATITGAVELAEFVIALIAGEGGGSPT